MPGGWTSPLIVHLFNISLCTTEGAISNWQYKNNFFKSNTEIEEKLESRIAKVELRYLYRIRKVLFKTSELWEKKKV